MAADVAKWTDNCLTCKQARGRVLLPQLRFTMADDTRLATYPWQDVIVDVQGPFTQAENGHKYILTYTCTVLKVPFLETVQALQTGYVSRALLSCIPER